MENQNTDGLKTFIVTKKEIRILVLILVRIFALRNINVDCSTQFALKQTQGYSILN